MAKKKADAILTADWHLREDTPLCREPEEFHDAQCRKLDFIRDLQREHECPILLAGDLFHHWKPSPNLLRWTLERLPSVCVAVAGQHDLPENSMDQFHRSGLAVLEASKQVRVLRDPDDDCVLIQQDKEGSPEDWAALGFPWGTEPRKRHGTHGLKKVALMHRLTWVGPPPFPGAEVRDTNAKALMKKMSGFDLIVTGDNHQSFTVCMDQKGVISYPNPLSDRARVTAHRLLVNPGCLTRQKASEAGHEPCVFLWYAKENRVERVFLPFNKGVVSREHIEEEKAKEDRVSAFVARLKKDMEVGLSFYDNLITYMDKNGIPEVIRKIVLEAIERG